MSVPVIAQTQSENLDKAVSKSSQTDSCQLSKPKQQEPAVEFADNNERVLSFDLAQEMSELKTHLLGNVELTDANTIIKANELQINHETNSVSATGEVKVQSRTAEFQAESLSQDGESAQLVMENGEFQLLENGAQGGADKIKVTLSEPTEFDNLTYSSCPKGDEDWQLSMESLALDHINGRGTARDTIFRVGDIPVFYLPYLTFPIDSRRQSGVLFPSFEDDEKNGLDVTLPIYWNIAPFMDATFSPRWIEKRGVQFGAETRLLTENTYSQWEFEHLDNDDVVIEQITTAVDPSLIDATPKRWLSSISHKARFDQNWRLDIESVRVSDSEYFRDFSSGLESSTKTHLESLAHLNYADAVWNIDFLAQADQSLIGEGIYQVLPSLRIEADKQNWGLRWQLLSEWTKFDHKDSDQTTGTRSHIAPSVSYPIENQWGYLLPKISWLSTKYEQENQLSNETTEYSRNLSIFSLDSGMSFEKSFEWAGSPYSHLLSPRFFYVDIPYKTQSQLNQFDSSEPLLSFRQLWRENRFTGIDRVGDTSHLSIALANSIIEKESGKRLFYFNLGKKQYFDDRIVGFSQDLLQTEKSSPWLAEADWSITQALSLKSFVEWDQKASQTNQAYTSIKFEPEANHIVNLSHRYRDIGGERVEETDFSFAWPINSEWRLVGRWYNDDSREQTIESMAGFEYESCCWAFRIVAQKYLNTQLGSDGLPLFGISNDYTSGIHFQFVFKGLGTAGKAGLSRMLESSIAGYQDPFLND